MVLKLKLDSTRRVTDACGDTFVSVTFFVYKKLTHCDMCDIIKTSFKKYRRRLNNDILINAGSNGIDC